MIKKILIALTAASMLLSTVVFAEEEQNTQEYESNKSQIDFLVAAGIAEGAENAADFSMDMTAKEFRAILLKLGITEEQLQEIDAFGIDYTAKSIVTRTEAAVPLVKLTGYDASAINKGGYERGYLSVASSLGFFKGVSAGSGDALSKAEAYRIIYNAVNAPYYPAVLYPGENYVDDELTFLTEKMDIYLLEGIVTSTVKSTLPKYRTATDGRAYIGDIEIMTNGVSVEKYFASNVQAWCRYNEDEDEYTLITIDFAKRNSVLKLKVQDIVSYENYTYEYYDEEMRIRKQKISPLIDIVYNGIGVSGAIAGKISMLPDEGNIIFIDNNGDNNCDVMLVSDYEVAIVDEARPQDLQVITKDFGNYEKKNIYFKDIKIYNEKGNEVDIYSVGEWSVLSLAKDGNGGYAYAVVSNTLVSGAVKTIDTYYGRNDIVLKDDTVITASKNLIADGDDVGRIFDVRNEYTFYLTADGTLAAYKILANTSYYIAYLAEIRMYEDEEKGESVLRIKAFDFSTENGVTLFVSEKCRYEGKKTAWNEIYQSMTGPDGYALDCVFRYKLNSKSEITDIDMPEDNNMSLDENKKGGIVRVANAPVNSYDSKGNPTGRRTAWGRRGSMVVYENGLGWIEAMPYDENATHLYVPENRLDFDKYYFSDKVKDKAVVCETYRIEGETEVPNILIELAGTGIPKRSNADNEYYNDESLVGDDDEMYIVCDMVYEWNEFKDEAEYKLFLKGRKGDAEHVVNDERRIVNEKVSVGSVISFALNADNEITHIKTHISRDNLKSGDSWYKYSGGLSAKRADFSLAYNKYDNVIALAKKNPQNGLLWTDIFYVSLNNIPVFVFDAKKKTVTNGSIADVNTYSSVGISGASRVFTYYKTGGLQMVIIYNGLEN